MTTRFSFRSAALLAFSFSVWVAAAPVTSAAATPAALPTVTVRVSQGGTTAHRPIAVMPADGSPVNLTLLAFPAAPFHPTSYSWAQVQPVINSWASAGVASFGSTSGSSAANSLSLPAPGVYQFQLTATDGTKTAVSPFWVQVWEAQGAVAPGQIGRNPGVAPPSSVRLLKRDSGPFHHPRLFFSASEWATLRAKLTTVPESMAGVAKLRSSLAANFDHGGTPINNLRLLLAQYASGGYSQTDWTAIASAYGFSATSVPGLFRGSVLGHYTDSSFVDALAAASYLAWTEVSPTARSSATPEQKLRFQQLATLAAAWSRFLLKAELDNPTAFTNNNSGALANYGLALVYDLLYDWMTTAQRTASRDYLYTIGNLYNTGGGGISITKSKSNPPSSGQNGVDFPNLADGILYPALVIEGEESLVSPSVLNNALFGSYAPAASSIDPAVTPLSAWPSASETTVRNLGRQIRANSEYILTPWGFYQNMTAYFNLGQNITAPAALALARRGENQWVTTNLYQALLQPLYNMAPRQSGGAMQILDHHDGAGYAGGDGQRNFYYIAKYMYPDDPLVDYVYRQATAGWTGNALTKTIFGSKLGTTTMASVASAKKLGLTKFDPLTGFAISRNGWRETDLSLVFNNFTLGGGHYHAEANSFSLFALGRVWSNPPSYHVVPNDAQQSVLIQRFPGSSDASQGYVGQGPGSYDYIADLNTTLQSDQPGGPYHGVLLEVNEDPGKVWTWFSGNAKPAYDFVDGIPVYADGSKGVQVNTGLAINDMLIPGLLNALIPSDATNLGKSTRFAKAVPYNPVAYAYRSVLTVRGANPYVLVIDDIRKDDSPQNYRWTMNNSIGFGPSGGVFLDATKHDSYASLEITPGATAKQAILFHTIDSGSQAGLPRLLVRDVSEQASTGQPVITIDDRPVPATPDASTNLTYGFDNNSKKFTYFPSRRLFIDRQGVVEPKYKVLLFPFLSGKALPRTSWNAAQTVLTIRVGKQVDTVEFDASQPDHRTRLKAFTRNSL